MPLENDNVLFSSEWDPSGLVKGAQNAIDAMHKVQQSQTTLQESMNTTDKAVQDTTASLSALEKQSKKTADETSKSAKKTADAFENVTLKINEFANRRLSPVIDITKANKALNELKSNFEKAFSPQKITAVFNTQEIEALTAGIQNAKGEFAQFSAIVDILSRKLTEFEPGTQEFNDLAAAVRAGNAVLNEYEKSFKGAVTETKDGETKFKSLRTQIKELRDELTRLEEAGQEETDQYKRTQIAAAKLTDQYGDMQQQIRILASDTKYLDFGVSAIQAGLSGFQAFSGALELFGASTDDAQKAQAKLLAIMNLVQGVQQLQNLLLKENVIQTVGSAIATKGLAVSERLLAVAFGEAAAASKGLQAALLTTGIGALLIALGFIVAKIIEWTDSTDDAKKAQEKLNAELEKTNKLFDEQLQDIDFVTKLRAEKLKQRGASEITIQADYQSQQQEKLQAFNDRLLQLDDLHNRATGDAAKKVNEERVKVEADRVKLVQEIELSAAQAETKQIEERRKKAKAARDKAIQDEKAANELLIQIRYDLMLKTQSAENQELLKLQEDYNKRLVILKKGGASTVELTELYLKQVDDVVKKYDKLRAAEEKQIQTELDSVRFDAAQARIENIKEEYRRSTETINTEAEKQRNDLQQRQTELLDQLLKDKTELLITPEQYDRAVSELNKQFDSLFDSVNQSQQTKLQNLAADTFQKSIQKINEAFEFFGKQLDETTSREIEQVANLYVKGGISYDNYQKKLTEIGKREGLKRLENERNITEEQIKQIEIRQDAEVSPDENNNLIKQKQDLQTKLADIDAEIAQSGADNRKTEHDEQVKQLESYIDLYSSFTQTILGFINQLDQAEQARLDRQIAYQQQRVEYAKYIATKGNAEYLELEQKRLDELQRKREAAAQREMAINQALTASAAVLAAVKAIAETGNVITGIAAGIAVLAAIGQIYAFVNSLQQPVAQFAEGEEFVGRSGNYARNKDSVPALLMPGERVVTTDKNKKYNKALHAIHTGTVPPDVLNDFVSHYHLPDIPAMDYNRLALATESKLANTNQETNRLLNQLVELYTAGTDEMTIIADERGLAIRMQQTMRQRKLRMRS